MATLFFDHLIEIQDLLTELDLYSIPAEEKAELVDIIDEIFHHHILNLILNHLPKEHHEEFVKLIAVSPSHAGVIEFVQSRVTVDISAEIRSLSHRVKTDLKQEFKKARLK